jgi:hypothetical protein
MSKNPRVPRAGSTCVTRARICGSLWVLANGAAAQPAIDNVDLSGDQPNLAAAVPVVAVDPSRRGRIAVAWRFIDPLGGPAAHTAGSWVCHVSISNDDGKTFADQPIDWGLKAYSRCNAPWVGFSARGDLYLAASLMGAPPAHAANGAPGGTAAPPPGHPEGTAAFAASHDGGRTWSPTVSVLPSNTLDRFETDPSIPAAAKEVPWDGARGTVDWSTNAIYISGAFPARPGEDAHSQRFYSASTDGGKTFGPIRAFGNAAWPERWDGDIAAAGGDYIASYIAAATPDPARKCPCAVIAASHDRGKTVTHELAADAAALDIDTLVHYPEVALDPKHRHRTAIILIASNKAEVTALVSANDGKDWVRSSIAQPAGVVSVTRPAVAFSPTSVLVAAWRGVHADGSYDIYAAASARGDKFGNAVKVSTEASRTPPAWVNTYAVRGDFHTSVAADASAAHLAWADARNGADVRVYYARVPLRDFVK